MEITYRASDPRLVAEVLRALNATYIEQHLTVHRPNGQYKFFDEQTEQYKHQLTQIEQQLEEFSRGPNAVNPETVRDEMLHQLTILNGSIASTRADMAQTENRMRALEDEANAIPTRMTTSVKRMDNPQLLQQLKGTLLNLELKRTDLLSKYQENYRPLQEIEQEIQKTRAAIAAEEAAPLREDTTDIDPTHTLIDGELAKAKAELNGLAARQQAMQHSATEYHAAVQDLEDKALAERDLLRELKATEQNYLLYSQKREEARINEALDQGRILNIAVAEEPRIPITPIHSPWLLAATGLLFAGLVSTGAVFVSEFIDPSFHAPSEIESFLDVPVLAAVSRMANGNNNSSDSEKRFHAEKPQKSVTLSIL